MTKATIKQGKSKVNYTKEVVQDAFNLTQKSFYNKWGVWSDDKAFTTTGNLMRTIKKVNLEGQ